MMIHLAMFNHLTIKTDNGVYGAAEHHGTEHPKCSFEIRLLIRESMIYVYEMAI